MNIKRKNQYWLDDDNILIVYNPRLFTKINAVLGFYYPEKTKLVRGEESLFKLTKETLDRTKFLLKLR